MLPILYERTGHEGRKPSPFSWRIRYAIAHKGVAFDYRPTRFADVETIRRLSFQHRVPIVDDNGRVIHDSWSIACWLEETYPDRPALFGGPAGRGLARTLGHWAADVLAPAIRPIISAGFIWCLAPEDRAYFRQSREADYGCSLEDYCVDRPRRQAELDIAVAPLEHTLAEQPFLSGEAPTYADYLVFSVFQYARLGCPDEILGASPALRRWRDTLAAAFDGLGNSAPGYPATRDGPDGR